jgi:hypothetical protein
VLKSLNGIGTFQNDQIRRGSRIVNKSVTGDLAQAAKAKTSTHIRKSYAEQAGFAQAELPASGLLFE